MLNSFDNRPAVHGLPAPAVSGHQAVAVQPTERQAAPMDGALTRLFLRRWLILFFVAIVLGLSLISGLSWRAVAWSCAVFCIGMAIIPRSRLAVVTTGAQERREEALPLRLARALIGALPEPAILLRQGGEIVAFNAKARDLFGGLKPGSHVSSATRSPQILDAVMVASPAQPMQTVMFSERIPVERHMAATVSWLAPGKRTGALILLFLHDLTEQHRLDQLRADFIANASHEIKTPLASLLGFIETLQGAARNDETARDRFLTIMAKQGERMARLIDNLMSLSRVEMQAHLKPRDTVVIDELVSQACDALEPMAAEANIEVEVRSNVDGAEVPGDRDELMQVFINLLHNAIKYGKPGGSVRVSLQRVRSGAAPAIEIAIEDDGPGIAHQHLPRLTERFYRVPGQTALEKGGTGLGLAIVKHVVNRHRGELRIVSEEGVGSRFTVVLTEHLSPKAPVAEPE
jgi:two-component system, OmpR family, phosphate regulon sensor histidine kinase PhoR